MLSADAMRAVIFASRLFVDGLVVIVRVTPNIVKRLVDERPIVVGLWFGGEALDEYVPGDVRVGGRVLSATHEVGDAHVVEHQLGAGRHAWAERRGLPSVRERLKEFRVCFVETQC